MMGDALINVGAAPGGAAFLGSVQQAVLLNDPNVRAAQARTEVAQADLRAARAEHDAASIRHSGALEASWDPITAGVVHMVGLGLLIAVPALRWRRQGAGSPPDKR
jgi:hypothetical protein